MSIQKKCKQVREHPLMMSDLRGGWGSEMTPKNRTLEGENRTKGGCRIKKSSDIVNGRSLSFLIFPLFGVE